MKRSILLALLLSIFLFLIAEFITPIFLKAEQSTRCYVVMCVTNNGTRLRCVDFYNTGATCYCDPCGP